MGTRVMARKQKIYMRLTYEDGGEYVSFGTRNILPTWIAERKEWEDQDHYCGDDKIKCIAVFDGTNLDDVVCKISECAWWYGKK